MPKTRVLAFAGSSRQGSLNQSVLKIAMEAAAAAGAEVESIDLRELALPVFDQDLEASGGLPAGVRKLQERMAASQAFLIASPEYNSTLTPLLVNALDWASRPVPGGQGMLASFTGKVAGLVSASPGVLGGLRGLFALREMLQNVGVMVVPDMAAVGGLRPTSLDASGKLTDEKQQRLVEGVAQKLVAIAGAMARS